MNSSTTFRTVGPLVVALGVSGFFLDEIYQRAVIELHGTVLSSETRCTQPENNRCFTTYVVRDDTGNLQSYVAGPSDRALQRRLPAGTIILKNRWSLRYSIDGRAVNDFPIVAYGGVILLSVVGAYWLAKSRGRSQRDDGLP